MANPFLPTPQQPLRAVRIADMDPKAFRLLIRDAVAWGVLMANVLLGLMIGLFAMVSALFATR